MENPKPYSHLIAATTPMQMVEPPIDLQMIAIWAEGKKSGKRFKKALKKKHQEQLVIIHNFQEYEKYYSQNNNTLVDSSMKTKPKYRLLIEPTKWTEWAGNEDLSIDISCEEQVCTYMLDNSLSVAYMADKTWKINKKGIAKEVESVCFC